MKSGSVPVVVKAVLYYQVEGFIGEWGLACQDCGETIKQKLQ